MKKVGIVIFSKANISTLRRSLKRFLQVLTPENASPVYFRFFDARTLYCFMRFGFRDQWIDFFKDITLIAAPYDYTNGWALYRFDEPVLKFATEQRSEWSWHTFDNKERHVEQYNITFPFRTIGKQQYEDMMNCTQQSFYHEIYNFLKKAFPEETAELSRKEILENITHWQVICGEQEYDNEDEDIVMYWSVLSFMGGDKFYENPDVKTVLAPRLKRADSKLSDLIYFAGKRLDNPLLMELGRSMIITVIDEDGEEEVMDEWQFRESHD